MFIDKVKIYVSGGHGGNGIVAFRREKYVPLGGPAGGNGGDGGSVILEVKSGLRTLLDLHYQKRYVAERGYHGEGSKRHGRSGKDITVFVPPGTTVRDAETGALLADLVFAGQTFVAAKGGTGGRGNATFVSSVHRAPSYAENGLPGEERWLILELKLLADIGLVGYPNVGKSTLLANVSAAKPKIGNYHFTTTKPKLGSVYLEQGASFVLADIPGLIEGASSGQGLGYQFLRHIERTKVVIHVLDASGVEGRDPIEDFHKINNELKAYGAGLEDRPQIVALNKFDLIGEEELFTEMIEYFQEKGYPVCLVSAVTGYGLKKLLYLAYEVLKREEQRLAEVEKEAGLVQLENLPSVVEVEEEPFTITEHDGIFIVSGTEVERLVRITDFENPAAVRRFQYLLKRKGFVKAMRKAGVREGDTVRIIDFEFDYLEDDSY